MSTGPSLSNRMKTRTSGVPCSVRWELVSDSGPKLCKHAGCIINGYLYVHGGLSNVRDSNSLDGLYRCNLKTGEWTDLRGLKNSPALSSHVMQQCGPEHLMMVGGWTGKKRDCGVVTYDLKRKKWKTEATSNFPGGAGLSSHAIVPLEERGSYVVYGREGSLRTQRKSGHAWVIRGWPGEMFAYNSASMKCESRSGHSAVAISPHQILVIGGRADKMVETHRPPGSARSVVSGVVNRVLAEPMVSTTVAKAASSNKSNTSSDQNGRREFVVFGGNGAALIYGGLMFSLGPFQQEPMGDFTLVGNNFHIPLTSADRSAPARAGAVGCVDMETGEAYMHGGYCGRNEQVCRELYRLVMD